MPQLRKCTNDGRSDNLCRANCSEAALKRGRGYLADSLGTAAAILRECKNRDSDNNAPRRVGTPASLCSL